MIQLRNKIKVNAFDRKVNQAAISEIFGNLKLGQMNAGVFNGRWGGNGPTVTSVDPSTNEPIAQIKTVQSDKVMIIFNLYCRAHWRSWSIPLGR